MVWVPVPRWRKQRLESLPPALAGDLAFRLFCTPQVSQWRPPQHARLAERARFHLRAATRERAPTPVGAVQLYTFDPDKGPPAGTVLVIHGWTSEASFMAALAEPIRRAGYRVVLMDMPAHGLSEGTSTDLIACARAVQAVGEAIGPLAGVVAHSFGGMVALLAMEGGPPMQARLQVPRIVLVSSPNRIAQITRLFAAHWGLEPEGLRQFEKRLERLGRRALSSFTSVKLLQSCEARALVVHARDDDAVPFSAALEIAGEVEGARLMACDGLGHRNILFAPQVARTAVAFVKEEAGERRTTLNTV